MSNFWDKGDQEHFEHGHTSSAIYSNNITKPGQFMNDMNPSGIKSRTLPQAHFKSLRCYRKFCRMMPFIINSYSLRTVVSAENAKLQLGRHWRHNNKVRSPLNIDHQVNYMYEILGNIEQQDVFSHVIIYLIAPQVYRGYSGRHGFSFLDEKRYGNKTTFMKNFYTGKGSNVY